MRKLLIITAALFFAGSVLGFSVRQTTKSAFKSSLSKTVIAQEAGTLEFTVTEGANGMPEPTEVEYQLTWPGILPGHVLYPVKMLRDKVLVLLTTNPLKKAELYLKLADKRLWSADLLAESGKAELAIETATKAEKYLEQAANQEKEAGEAGEETDLFLTRLNLASRKHEQVLARIRARIGDPSGAAVGELVGYPQRVQEQVRERRGGGEE